MKIINPLYDNGFKYLMENEQIAKIVLSIILDTQVIRFQSKPQETTIVFTGDVHISRFDFRAVISDTDGEEKVVLIEVQKYEKPDYITRFRKYLAKNYLKEETIINNSGTEVTEPLPIVTIYILGFELQEFDSPAVRIENRPYDIIKGKYLDVKSKFADLLTHPSYILQASQKKNSKGTRLEKFLSIFLEKIKNEPSNYIIELEDDENINDIELKKIFDYLNAGTHDEELVRVLEFERQMNEGFEAYEYELQTIKQDAEKSKQEAEQSKQEAEEAKQAFKHERDLKHQAELIAKQTKTKLLESAKSMKNFGMPVDDIVSATGLDKKEIENL